MKFTFFQRLIEVPTSKSEIQMKNYTRLIEHTVYSMLLLGMVSCTPPDASPSSDVKALGVNTSYFIKDNLVSNITTEKCTLSDRTQTECYKIVTKSVAHEHTMGPWCPRHINDAKDKGGIWFEGGKVYDVDGHFISNIGAFYKDEKWKLYNEDGSIKVTLTQEACEGAAKPNVEEIYKNHCVECQPSFYHDHTTTYTIPVKPIFRKAERKRGRSAMGLAFNGVNFDPPAPTQAILAAHFSALR